MYLVFVWPRGLKKVQASLLLQLTVGLRDRVSGRRLLFMVVLGIRYAVSEFLVHQARIEPLEW